MARLSSYRDSDATGEFVVFDGSVRELAPLAPNNVNTMACAALAGFTLGFDRTRGRLVVDKALTAHVIGMQAAPHRRH